MSEKEDTPGNKNDDALESLGVRLVEQDSLERKVAEKADQAILTKEDASDAKRLQQTEKKRRDIEKRIQLLKDKIDSPRTKISDRESLRKDIEWIKQNDLVPIERDLREIKERIQERKVQAEQSQEAHTHKSQSSAQLASETRQDYLIRTGKITAFGTSNAFEQNNNNTENSTAPLNHQDLLAPGIGRLDRIYDREEDYELGEVGSDSDDTGQVGVKKAPDDEARNLDDGDEAIYQERLNNWIKKRSDLRKKFQPDLQTDDTVPEWFKPHPTVSDAVLNSSYKVPGDFYGSLFDYQKTCVQWLWELYFQKTGGIIGDEMGLGKTIQIISFLAGLHYSGKLDKPVLIVCPATVLRQWSNEFHIWWPPLRTIVLHSIGTGMGNKKKLSEEEVLDKMLEMEDFDDKKLSSAALQSHINVSELVDRVFNSGHVLITTYVGLRIYAKHLLHRKWGYVVLDEGHKIRNPNSDISLTCKQLKTPNRIILSGTPIQNNLIELWSLFDFIFPGRLGTLPVFEQQFSVPINIGGYANATNVQVQTGYKCAVVLRDLISPYLLRRVKADVAKDLPQKNEMVLFCKLTKYQLNLYEKFLKSDDLTAVLSGKRNVLYGVDILRKICNHPDLVEPHRRKGSQAYGDYKKSGKMQVVKALVELWKKEGHKILLFTQTRQMLDILQQFICSLNNTAIENGRPEFNYLRMDGSTPIKVRQQLVDSFNEDPKYDIFLLTTRVGGLGVNLTGANRVIIYDPDWNPSTDVQARERAWRLGQKKPVTIYRLMIANSIEEKIYHRQIFKQFLTNKILKDPKQKRFFKLNDLHDLFTLGDQSERGTETGDLFSGVEMSFGGSQERKSKKLTKTRAAQEDDDLDSVIKISGVDKLQQFQGDADQNIDSNEARESSDLMAGIFANSGVHSALEHDSIMGTSRPDVALVDKEASKIAAEATKKLRESRKQVRKAKIGTPTFTGRFGSAGRVAKPQSGSSSSSILRDIRAKRELEKQELKGRKTPTSASVSSRSVSPHLSETVPYFNETQLAQKIRDCVSDKKGPITSAEVFNSLDLKFGSYTESQVVKSLLRSICEWQPDTKSWVLKEEFTD